MVAFVPGWARSRARRALDPATWQRWFDSRSRYSFVDRWLLQGTLEEAATVLFDTECLPCWWNQFRHVWVQEHGRSDGCLRTLQARIKGYLPYSLRLEFRVVAVAYPHDFEVRVGGDFRGRGCGRLTAEGDRVCLDLELDIQVRRPLLRLLSAVARPVMAGQHCWTMHQGQRGLDQELSLRRQRSIAQQPSPAGTLLG